MSNTGNIIRKNLHPVIKKDDLETINVTEATAIAFDGLVTVAISLDSQRYLDTATSEWLDRWGTDLGDARANNESDANYRLRIQEALKGRGVTTPRIRQAVNRLLNDQECEIIEWQDAKGRLPVHSFAVNLPVYDFEGFYLDDEGDDEEEDGAYLDIGTYCTNWLNLAGLWPIQKIADLVNRLKSSGKTFEIWSGDYLYLEVVNGSS